MKKLVGILIGLVIVLAGLLIYGYFHYKNLATTTVTVEDKVVGSVATKEQANRTDNNETYQFKDIESMRKATSEKQAFERIFGKNRLFDDFKGNRPEIKYHLKGIDPNIRTALVSKDGHKYNPEKPYLFFYMSIAITAKSGIDTRMEMIDFLHYLKFSGLTKPHIIKESLPEDSVKVDGLMAKEPEQLPPFTIFMTVFPQIKPGMNMPEPLQNWMIKSDIIEQMDFSDKQDILNNITMYGKFQ
ncbi:hypothetical protein M3226_05185 [Neobacillus cucumis]|uniref:hypothetical protein n=1 Tax=Neobacillus cucumis TaxID=1740721 RepID=UPI00203C48E0|nr:hypothetical protein [Neobacillus cucumis]MCM3725091.1 hypothetical protein [Neobacillus cucumis]